MLDGSGRRADLIHLTNFACNVHSSRSFSKEQMELRSSTRAATTAAASGAGATLPADVRPMFEEGVVRIFLRWTALALAVENEWGGSNSRQKADQLIQDVIDYFYKPGGQSNTGSFAHDTLNDWVQPDQAGRGLGALRNILAPAFAALKF
jgi:Pre-rRNA-processing protein TSR2